MSVAIFSSWYILCEAEHETSLTWCTSDSTSQRPTADPVLHTHVTTSHGTHWHNHILVQNR